MSNEIETIDKTHNWIKYLNDKSNMNKKWIVFWMNNFRIGSVELNESNWIEVKKTFHYNIIQTDISGTVHINIFGLCA